MKNIDIMNEETNMDTPEVSPEKKKRWLKRINRRKFLVFIIAVLLIVGWAGTFYYYNQNRALTKNPNATAQKELADLVSKVNKLMILPTGETPDFATITDPTKLTKEPFFQNAMVGDKVLIYYTAKLAILYRPSVNKIVEVAPLVTQNNPTAPAGNAQTQTSPKTQTKQ
jgi:hypothetical protein